MRRSNTIAMIVISVCAVVFIGVGFAAVNDQLNVFGNLSLEVKNATMLQSGDDVHDALVARAPGVERVVFSDRSACDYFTYEDGVNIHTPESPEGSIKLFWDETSKTAYILADDSRGEMTMYANYDTSEMFSGITTLTEVHFYNCTMSMCTNTEKMFAGCSSLTTVYVSTNPDMSAVTRSENMFEGCTVLVGGRGTAVYSDPATPALALDKTYARIDDIDDKGFYTLSIKYDMPYFVSDRLSVNAPNYTVHDADADIRITNAQDADMYSEDDLRYRLVYEYKKADVWTEYAPSVQTVYIPGGSYQERDYTVAPITVDGETYYDVRVKALGLNDGVAGVILSATFHFDSTPYEAVYRFDAADNIIYLTLHTNMQGGAYTFAWQSGVAPDNSDPTLVFADVTAASGTHTAALPALTTYEFRFYVTDAALLAKLESHEITPESQVVVTLG